MLSINQMTPPLFFLIKLETPFPRHSFLIMITRRDVDSVRNLFGAQEAIYWVMHPIERVHTFQQIDEWDGYFWTVACNKINEADKRGDWTLFFRFYLFYLRNAFKRSDGGTSSVCLKTSV